MYSSGARRPRDGSRSGGMSNDLMAKAVELDTARQKDEQPKAAAKRKA